MALDYAFSLNGRGIVYFALGKLPKAVEDYSKAIVIFTPLVEQEKRQELANDLARSLNNRGNAFHALGKFSRGRSRISTRRSSSVRGSSSETAGRIWRASLLAV